MTEPDSPAAPSLIEHTERIDFIWESTQAAIALSVVLAAIAAQFAWTGARTTDLIGNAFFLVIGFYFGRTNHARLGDTTRYAKP